MAVEIATELLAALRAAAATSPDAELCGLLFGTEAHIEAAVPCRNVAPDPARRFEIDPAALLAAHRAMRAGGPRLIGCYHSHPSGGAVPSGADADAAAPDGALWLIVTPAKVCGWRALPSGALRGRFEAVELIARGLRD